MRNLIGKMVFLSGCIENGRCSALSQLKGSLLLRSCRAVSHHSISAELMGSASLSELGPHHYGNVEFMGHASVSELESYHCYYCGHLE